MQPTTKRNLTLVFIIAVIVICIGYTAWKLWPHPKKSIAPPHEEPVTSYNLFSESDNGTSTRVIVGSTAIVQLPEKMYGEPVTLYDADGKILTPAIEHYSGYMVISMTIPTTTQMTVSAHGLESSADFSLTLQPVVLH